MKAKYAELLNEADVKRWFENLVVKSIISATAHLLVFTASLTGLILKRFLNSLKPRLSGMSLQAFHRMEKEDKAGFYSSKG
ncbi:MAG: hypothetical protein QXV37_02730 [Candidatus Jordarchaeaceae archaeon]